SVPHVRAGALPGSWRVSRLAPPHTGRAARRVRWLTRGGLVAACAVGAGTTWGLGWGGLALLAAFFLSGSVLSQLAERQGPHRTARQVLANGGVAGAATIAWLAYVLGPRCAAPGLATVTGAGVAGMLADSLLGATLQGKYQCPACDARFERANTVCHELVILTGGWRWLDNDGVN